MLHIDISTCIKPYLDNIQITLFVGRYESQECEIELENISMDDNGNWTCLILDSLTNRTVQDTVNVKVIDYGSTGC